MQMLSTYESLAILRASISDYEKDPGVKSLILAMRKFGYSTSTVSACRSYTLLMLIYTPAG